MNSNDRLEIKLCLRIVTVFLQKKKFRMKKLTLIRHAKSSWSDYGLRDHDRPLADRGLRDAPFMAQLMASRGWLPDALVSSTALRARTTAEFFAAALGWQPAVVQLDKRIYEASVPTLLDFIAHLPDQWNHIALFGHNPTFTQVANLFYQKKYIDNLPTCGIVELVAEDAGQWSQFTPDTARVTAVHYPKQYAH